MTRYLDHSWNAADKNETCPLLAATKMSNLCAICYSDIVAEKTGITTLRCSHSFHLGCIARWILKSETCPCCLSEVTEFEKIEPICRPRSLSYEYDITVPILQLPPYILRLQFSTLNPDAPEFIPSYVESVSSPVLR